MLCFLQQPSVHQRARIVIPARAGTEAQAYWLAGKRSRASQMPVNAALTGRA